MIVTIIYKLPSYVIYHYSVCVAVLLSIEANKTVSWYTVFDLKDFRNLSLISDLIY